MDERLTTRAPELRDARSIADLRNAVHVDEIGRPFTDEAEVESVLTTPGLDLGHDALLVVAPGDELVGSMEVWGQEPFTTIHLDNYVHPSWRGHGIGTFVLDRSEERATQIAQAAPAGRRVVVRHSVWVGADASERFLHARGYRLVRFFRTLRATLEEPPTSASWPSGISVRTLADDEDLRPVYEAETEAFRDHWGTATHPYDVWVHELRQDRFDPSLVYLAHDDAEIVGVATWQAGTVDDPGAAYLATLSVRRAWRQRGIGTGLLREGLGELFRRGHRRITTIVDSASLTGADRLYERVGMRTETQFASYEKQLRAGADEG